MRSVVSRQALQLQVALLKWLKALNRLNLFVPYTQPYNCTDGSRRRGLSSTLASRPPALLYWPFNWVCVCVCVRLAVWRLILADLFCKNELIISTRFAPNVMLRHLYGCIICVYMCNCIKVSVPSILLNWVPTFLIFVKLYVEATGLSNIWQQWDVNYKRVEKILKEFSWFRVWKNGIRKACVSEFRQFLLKCDQHFCWPEKLKKKSTVST